MITADTQLSIDEFLRGEIVHNEDIEKESLHTIKIYRPNCFQDNFYFLRRIIKSDHQHLQKNNFLLLKFNYFGTLIHFWKLLNDSCNSDEQAYCISQTTRLKRLSLTLSYICKKLFSLKNLKTKRKLRRCLHLSFPFSASHIPILLVSREYNKMESSLNW